MHPNARTIEKFYTAMREGDTRAITAAYHPEKIHFTDPVFDLRGREAGAMWEMLIRRARDFSLEFSGVEANDREGRARWEPRYTFTQTGRPVHNVIDARFVFEDGLIVRHVDSFDLWRWSRMALGPVGAVLGWSPIVQRKIKAQANGALRAYVGA